ncbi:hypothetical protein HMSSN036_65230 [Paenibacillus macerans]|nr:hypothetical protein HMSSN036_65230 [Paenibacillus macerans]
MKKSMLMVLTLVLSLTLAACGQGGNAKTNTSGAEGGNGGATSEAAANNGGNKATSDLSGSVLSVGSSALQPLVDQVSKKFMEQNPNVSIQVQGGGSGTGLTQVSGGQADIGNSDVFAEEKLEAAQASELVDHQVAVVAMAAVVNPDVTVDNLTKDQLVQILRVK